MTDLNDQASAVMGSTISSWQDYLVSDPYTYLAQTGSQRKDSLFRSNPEVYLDFLEDWDYVQGLVEAFASPIREIITKNTIQVSFKDEVHDAKYSDFINNKIEEMGLRNKLYDAIPSIVYRGAFFKFLAYDHDKKKFSLIDVKDPWKTIRVDKLSKPIGYMRSGHFINQKDGVFASYQTYVKRRLSLTDVNQAQVKKQILDDIGQGLIAKELEPEIVAYTHYLSKSIFYGQAQKLFQIFLNDFMSQFLALKDSVRQDLITVTVQDMPKKVIDLSQVTQSIEDAINQGSNLVIDQNPQTMLQQVIFAMFNSARVLPALANYSQIQGLELPALKEKRASLLAETEELKREATSNLGIPDELQGGQGNRWEILSRSDKYLTSINAYVSVCDDVVKHCVQNMLMNMGVYVELEDINFTFVNNTPLQSQQSRGKAGLFIDSLRDSLSAINGVKALLATGFYDPEKVFEEFQQQLEKWNLPFTSAYLTADDLMAALNDPNNPINTFTPVEFSEREVVKKPEKE